MADALAFAQPILTVVGAWMALVAGGLIKLLVDVRQLQTRVAVMAAAVEQDNDVNLPWKGTDDD
jgi:hypothetical protein